MGISLGLVGLGEFGRAFAELFKTHPLVDRVALCDLEPERIRRFADLESWRDKFNPRDAYTSLDDICKAKLDALVIITQHWLHAPQCVQALEAGKHVYSAVPVITVPDADEILEWCDRLVQTVKRTGQQYMLGETTYYHPQAMYCRRRAAEGAFGAFTYCEGEYFHPFDWPKCDLREVLKHRRTGKAGQTHDAMMRAYIERGLHSGPMHYPTHSTSGPMSVMKAHAVNVCAWGQKPVTDDHYFQEQNEAFSNETGLFHMSNGSVMRILEHRECGGIERETFRIYGTKGSFEQSTWKTHQGATTVKVEEMRDPLPAEVAAAWRDKRTDSVAYGGHGGSHAYLVHEFVDAITHERVPAINVWEAVRYMAPGAVAHKSALAGGKVMDVPDWGDAPK